MVISMSNIIVNFYTFCHLVIHSSVTVMLFLFYTTIPVVREKEQGLYTKT